MVAVPFRCAGSRILAFVAVALAAAVTGAAPQQEAPAPAAKPPTRVTAASASDDGTLSLDVEAANKPWKGDLDGMIERGFIRVLVVPGRTFYFVDKGVQRGATYDLVRQFEDDLNKKLLAQKKLKDRNVKVRVFFVPVGREQIASFLTSGRGDIAAAGITVTEYGKSVADFSAPLYAGIDEIVVSAPDAASVASVDDLSGKEVFVRKASSYYESLGKLNKQFAARKKPPVKIKLAPNELEDEDILEMVSAGLVQRTVVKAPLAKFWQQVFPKLVVSEEARVRTGANIAWAFRKDSPQLKAVVDDFIRRHGKGTMIGNMLLKKYFSDAKYVQDAASAAERRKFEQLVDLFRKYGDQYDVDWLLMAAQGYQESQLNQQARSKVGAIGVMQVMPATGKDMNVGDIGQVENNINAGIKYMRWMMDHYYADAPMSRLDKALFAFASYNAGPARISGLRKEAERRGLDPNKWFHNVEYVAAEKIGAETVTYVGNIFKYYVAYRLIMEQRGGKPAAPSTQAAAPTKK
jgi:membrane-bound lytic murein transglycosylase MltF